MAEEKLYQVIVSDRAKRMLGTHIRFLAKVSKSAATEKKQQFLREIRTLSRMPQRFPFLDALYIPPNKYHKMYVENWYLVLYQIRDDTVYVDHILDCRKDYDWLIHS